MKRLILCLLGSLAIYLGGAALSWLSGCYGCMGSDVSEESTIGIVHRYGFPVWFYRQAPGLSIVSGWDLARFEWNTRVWWGILLLAAWGVTRIRRRRKA